LGLFRFKQADEPYEPPKVQKKVANNTAVKEKGG
jgi:hypothetical protein